MGETDLCRVVKTVHFSAGRVLTVWNEPCGLGRGWWNAIVGIGRSKQDLRSLVCFLIWALQPLQLLVQSPSPPSAQDRTKTIHTSVGWCGGWPPRVCRTHQLVVAERRPHHQAAFQCWVHGPHPPVIGMASR